MGAVSGSLPWYTMMMLHRSSSLLQKVDDPLNVSHTHTVAGFIGGILSAFITVWKLVVTSAICLVINQVVPLRMAEVKFKVGDDAVHGEEAYCGMMGRRLASFNGRLETA
ncbi:hypothetical protein AMTR_s00001p00163560 [Amborella trichopoda]|uniref:Ammonium transporter AmtB-like domain-containing protein n=1 Tax=Amborella trichopoda TaxID=13333 RepID=W1NLY9_AMBTC|nr:hypothetical protein AMTR_s00001p00163560 [Amborella trichopoda]